MNYAEVKYPRGYIDGFKVELRKNLILRYTRALAFVCKSALVLSEFINSIPVSCNII